MSTDENTVTLWAVIFTDDGGMTSARAAHLTREEAFRAGAELARSRWADDEELSVEPFPEVADDKAAMDVLRTALDVSLEVEAVRVNATVLRAALTKLEEA